MTIDAILAFFYMVATGYDIYTTRRRALKYGINIETSPPLRWMMYKLGIDRALTLFLAGHMFAVGIALLFDPSNLILAIAVGARAVWMYFQINSLELEEDIDALIALQKVSGRDDAASPSDSPSPPSE